MNLKKDDELINPIDTDTKKNKIKKNLVARERLLLNNQDPEMELLKHQKMKIII